MLGTGSETTMKISVSLEKEDLNFMDFKKSKSMNGNTHKSRFLKFSVLGTGLPYYRI